MPKSKRDRVVALTVVKKKDRAWKESLVQSIRDCISEYPSVFVFRCENMRNDAFKGLREDLSETSRFFVGGNKLRLWRRTLRREETKRDEKRAAKARRGSEYQQQQQQRDDDDDDDDWDRVYTFE